MKSKAILTGFALLMLVYSAWRSYDYIGGNLEGLDDTTRFIVSVAFLAFSEIGLILWLHVGRPNATTDTQETVASAVIWVNFAGILVMNLGDLLRRNTLYSVDMAYLDPILLLAPWLLVAVNLGAYLVYTMSDSDEQLAREERRLRHEETSVEMEARRSAVRELRANREAIGAELAPHYYADIKNRVTGRTVNRFNRKAEKMLQAPPAAPAPGNGKVTSYAAEAEAVRPLSGKEGTK